jgi:DNA gyrase subunit B
MTIRKELFVVEGKSAASTIQHALHRPTQAVHAMQGKVVNASKAPSSRVMTNPACRGLFAALGCGAGSDCDPTRVNYARVILLTDPDPDGAHARALLIDLFDRYLHPLLSNGMIYAAIPPLFRLSADSGRSVDYAWSDGQLRSLQRGTFAQRQPEITRFKGVAQFTSDECRALFLNAGNGRQVRLVSSRPAGLVAPPGAPSTAGA